jgi:hypothetical protein
MSVRRLVRPSRKTLRRPAATALRARRLFSQELAGILNRKHGSAIRASRNGGERRVLPSCLEPYTACSLSAETCRSHPARGRATAIRRRHETAR